MSATRWTVGPVAERFSKLAAEYLRVAVRLDTSAGPGNPTSLTVKMALLQSTADPQTADWQAASWDTTPLGLYVAQYLVSGLTQGSYYVWVQIADSPETVVVACGTLEVT